MPLSRFIARTAIFAAVFIALMTAFYIITDPLKTLRWYSEYYSDREQINAGVVTLANFDHYVDSMRYDSFIIGNSLSQYCYINDWQQHIGHDTRPYHLASSSQSVFTTRRFLQHAIERVDTIRNILIAFDLYALSDTTEFLADYYDTDPPKLFTPCLQPLAHIFYATHALNRGILFSWTARTVTGKFPTQDIGYPRWATEVGYDPVHNEIYRTSIEVWLDTARYEEVATFEQRAERLSQLRYHTDRDMLSGDNQKVIDELHRIRELLDQTEADWRFVILPSHVAVTPTAHDDTILRKIFGSRYYNMSEAATEMLRDPRNYLDPGHPRPLVFREILNEVYSTQP